MNDFDELLRETLRDRSWDVPVASGIREVVETGARRIRRRRQYLTLTAVVTAVALALTTIAAVRDRQSAAPEVVTPPKPFSAPGHRPFVIGDGHEVYVPSDDGIAILRGPDGCLS